VKRKVCADDEQDRLDIHEYCQTCPGFDDDENLDDINPESCKLTSTSSSSSSSSSSIQDYLNDVDDASTNLLHAATPLSGEVTTTQSSLSSSSSSGESSAVQSSSISREGGNLQIIFFCIYAYFIANI
jgi:hypothetical protein